MDYMTERMVATNNKGRLTFILVGRERMHRGFLSGRQGLSVH